MSKIIKLDSGISSSRPPETPAVRPRPVAARTHLIFNEIQRPTETIHRIHDALLPYATPCNIPPGRLLSERPGEEALIWLVTAGSLSIFRVYDDLNIGVSEAPLVTGLQEIFAPFGRHYFRVSRGATLSSMPVSLARAVLAEHQLWEDVAQVFAYYMRVMTYRDEHLVSRSSYTAIRAKLMEYMDRRELLVRNRTGIVAYIQSTTLLSRSLIYHVLSVLARGGYIRMARGKLEEIIHLPENF